ncbi:alpha,alpha-phosphotrehalase [Mesomycoplasma neurolyticum]|uniref:Trehalose-6-phosphate hydrolase n=1 Tax=Mesomycoplasma neurolyticum TaxID=2120 RepID=A0A449A4K1_9BACT|nr:alpha,alpha-phosphotrehalase [Mesomycoplasma neurolyticum]VEU59175.1 Trehalose-6-phosphate hydrolase [Mesomycoplasma neurolyticum]
MNFRNKIIYQIYPLSFKDFNNDGFGDLKGIISKLDYLEWLGIDVIWITPIFKSPKKDNFYDVSNYYEIDPVFGTINDFKELINKAKEKNIEIMIDMVFNHSSTSHVWFQKALKNVKKYQKFYFFENNINNEPPNNWKSKFGGSAWNFNKEMNKWNLALFDKTQADLNWNNPLLRKEIFKIVNYWSSLGVKGFRFDVINLISKPNNFTKCISLKNDGKEFYTDGPNLSFFLKELNKNTFLKTNKIISVGEMSSTNILEAVKHSNENYDQLSMIFNFHHLKLDYKNNQKWNFKKWNKSEFKNILIEWQKTFFKNNANIALFFNNHDQPRSNSRFGNIKKFWFESSTLFSGLIFTLYGTPYIYQGEEIGMINPNFKKIENYNDVETLNFYKQNIDSMGKNKILKIISKFSRDNSRTPFQWNGSKNAGFSFHKPWINVSSSFKQINLDNQISNKKSVVWFYKNLIYLRKNNEILTNGKITFLKSNSNLFVFKRNLNNTKWLFIFNLSQKQQNISQFVNENLSLIFSNTRCKIKNFLSLKPLNFYIFKYEKK